MRKDDFEVNGISRAIIDVFSKRTQEIESLAKKLNLRHAAAKGKSGQTTRKHKGKKLDWEQLKDIWHSQLTYDQIQAVHFTHEAARGGSYQFQENHSRAFDLALEHLVERNSVVSERSLLAETLRRGVGEVTLDGISKLLSRSDILRASYDGEPVDTTKAVMAEEKELIALARRGRGSMNPIPLTNPELLARLNDGQRDAANHLMQSNDRFSIVAGKAGVGKSTMLIAAKKAIEAAGYHVTVLAPTASASRITLRRDGVTDADTLQQFLHSKPMQQQAAGNVLLLGEASLAGVSDMLSLARIAEKHNIRVGLLGDRMQHKSVSRGNILVTLEDFGGAKRVDVSDILRQRGDYKEIVKLFAMGKVIEGLDRLRKQHAIKTEGHDALAEDYYRYVCSGLDVLAISPTHRAAQAVTVAIRNRLKQAGIIGEEENKFTSLVDQQMTVADRKDRSRYEPGMVARFVRSKGPFKSGQLVEVNDQTIEALTEHASAHRIYQRHEIGISPNDRLRITGGGRSLCDHRLDNGATFTVKSVNQNKEIVLSNGWRLPSDYGLLQHDWVVTSYTSQSRSVDAVLIAQGRESFAATNTTQAYVSVSRGKHTRHAVIYTDDPQGLRAAMAREDKKITAHEAIPKQSVLQPTIGRLSNKYPKLAERFRHYLTIMRPRMKRSQPQEQQYGHEPHYGRA